MKILIVEDHQLFREVIRKLCIGEFHYKVIGEAASGAEALNLLEKIAAPDLVLLDLVLPDLDGFEVVEKIQTKFPRTRILVLSSHCNDYTLFRVEESGVHGFIDKNSQTLDSLRKALEIVGRGQCYFSEAFQAAKLARRANPNAFTKVLSLRERDVLALIGQSLTDDEIGERLGIRKTTAQTHRSQIMRKLGVQGTPKLINFAIRHGFSRVSGADGAASSAP